MQHVIVENLHSPLISSLHAEYCASFLCRLRGFTFRRQIRHDEGLLRVYPRENRLDATIHMFFVFFDLAIVWINGQMRVVDVQYAHRWKSMIAPRTAAKYVLEISPQRLSEF